MASSGVNVLRWSALGLGVFYGIYHQSSIRSADRTAAAKQEYQRKEQLIAQAKQAYVKKTAPKSDSVAGGVITDPEDPKFDLEAYLTRGAAES